MMTKGLVIAGLAGGSGKSVVTVGLIAALVGQGKRVVPFKKGPDYIDAGWLKLAGGDAARAGCVRAQRLSLCQGRRMRTLVAPARRAGSQRATRSTLPRHCPFRTCNRAYVRCRGRLVWPHPSRWGAPPQARRPGRGCRCT